MPDDSAQRPARPDPARLAGQRPGPLAKPLGSPGTAFERVQQADWVWPRRGDWLARLDECLLADDRPGRAGRPQPGLPAGGGLGRAFSAHRRVRAALLVAPPDTERADMPPQLAALAARSCASACPSRPGGLQRRRPLLRAAAPARWRQTGVPPATSLGAAGTSMPTAAWATGPTACSGWTRCWPRRAAGMKTPAARALAVGIGSAGLLGWLHVLGVGLPCCWPWPCCWPCCC
jgi:hypothetical protein